MDWKHIVAAVVGLILGILGSVFHIPFGQSPVIPTASVMTK